MISEVKKRRVWLVPIAAAALLAGTSFLAFERLERTLMAEVENDLVTRRNTATAAIQIWADGHRAQVELLAADPEFRAAALTLVEIGTRDSDPREALLESPAQAAVRDTLLPSIHRIGGRGEYVVVTPSGLFVAWSRTEAIGETDPDLIGMVINRVMKGETVVTEPTVYDQDYVEFLLGAGVRDLEDRIVGVFGYGVRADGEFATILETTRPGASGEAYIFSRDGRLLSASRFDDTLRNIGLLEPLQSSPLNIQIRDPGGSLAEGFVPERPLLARPLTVSAAGAISGETGVDVKGYRDYRGTEVVGAWTWLAELQFGLAVELDRDEALRPVIVARQTFHITIALLVLGAIGLLIYSIIAERLRRSINEVRQLGRYRVESKIGKGGMGTVYLARHSLLKRPTALKVLNPDRAGKEGIKRFEREVQTTSALRHPNTIEIYDYGYTSEGTFYYAMEHIEGPTLSQVVAIGGPLPEARVVHLLKQACGSIAEAHESGFIHRDIKPANIMVCERGGIFDFVKVLDFGLVRSQNQTKDVALTDATSITGTPLFMPPEVVRDSESLDARGDVYQLGLVGYFLLTGQHAFTGDTAMDVMLKQVNEQPVEPSKALGKKVTPALEQLLLECLSKSPDDRPATAGVLLRRLEECALTSTWSQEDARRASFEWEQWKETRIEEPDSSSTAVPSAVDLAERTPTG